MKTVFEVEIQRRNVTPAQFLSYVRNRVDHKGGRMIRTDLDLDYFKSGNDLNFDIKHGVDDDRHDLDGVHEKSVSKPYSMQTYIKYPDGMMFNEICEFEFDDEKTGHGYYYLINVEVNFGASPEEVTPAAVVDAIDWEVEKTKARSAWQYGVKVYAFDLLAELAEGVRSGYITETDLSNRQLFEKAMLNGAQDWAQYSEGGCSLIYDRDIAYRLCTQTELNRTDYGRLNPNISENWIDVQSRALYQAAQMILNIAF